MLSGLASGLTALPRAGLSFASTQAMWRFLNNDAVTLPTLAEPLREAALRALSPSPAPVVLVMHDWSMINYGGHTSKTDRLRRTHAADLGYELAVALLVDAADGAPLGPMELRLRTAVGVLSTRPGGARVHSAHVEELADAMAASRAWGLDRTPVHIVDREADSVGHYRDWDAAGQLFLVRADDARIVRRDGLERPLPGLVEDLHAEGAFADVPGAVEGPGGVGRLRVAEAAVVLDRPARRTIGGRKREVAGVALGLRLVVSEVVGPDGGRLARWLLLTNAPSEHDAATIARWYAWRWRIESYFKLLKSAGQEIERWEQESGAAIARRLLIASMACLTVWSLRREPGPGAAEVRRLLVRLSGRQMKWGVESTAPALLAGLEKLLAMLDVLEEYTPAQLRKLVRDHLPHLFDSS